MRRTAPSSIHLLPALLVSILAFGITSAFAQDLGDLARQERQRVMLGRAHVPRVFTNEDLARPKILGAAEQQQASATPSMIAPSSVAVSPVTAAISVEPTGPFAPAPVWPEGTPLGDVARYYRQQKQLRVPVLEEPVLVQAKNPDPEPAPLSRIPEPPRNRGAKFSPPQFALKPRRIIATTAPTAREAAPPERVVRVRRGDSLWKIARLHLGDGNQWREIAAANPEIANPDHIRTGQQIRLPGERAAMTAGQRRVEAGDSLWMIAKAQWGTGAAWRCITALNPEIQDSGRIYPGQVLTLPASCPRAA